MSQSLTIQKQSGNTLTIIRQGANAGTTTLQPATSTTLGGVKIGSGVVVDGTGVITVTAGSLGLATVATTGLYSSLSGKPDLTVYLTTANAATTYVTPSCLTYSNITGTPNLSVYLTIASAASTYQPLGNYVTPSCLTYSNISGTPNLSVYQTIATNTYANLSGAPNISLYAPLASPSFTGNATAPTAANGTATTQLATTAFVGTAITNSGARSGIETPNAISNISASAGSNSRFALADHVHMFPTTGATAGSYGNATNVATFTIDAYGRVMTAGTTAIAIAAGSVSGLAASATTDTTNATNISSGTLPVARLGVGSSTISYASSVTWAVNLLQTAVLTLGGASTAISFSGAAAGGTYVLILKQDATGSRSVTWTGFKWPSGIPPVLSTTANAIDVLTFVYDGTSLLGVAQKGFA